MEQPRRNILLLVSFRRAVAIWIGNQDLVGGDAISDGIRKLVILITRQGTEATASCSCCCRREWRYGGGCHLILFRPCSVSLFPAGITVRSPWIAPVWIETRSQENMCSVNPRVGCIPGEPGLSLSPPPGNHAATPGLYWVETIPSSACEGAVGQRARRASGGGGGDSIKDTGFSPASISSDGHFLTDFGMARIFGNEETEINTRKVVGTYGYMSPEYGWDLLCQVGRIQL